MKSARIWPIFSWDKGHPKRGLHSDRLKHAELAATTINLAQILWSEQLWPNKRTAPLVCIREADVHPNLYEPRRILCNPNLMSPYMNWTGSAVTFGFVSRHLWSRPTCRVASNGRVVCRFVEFLIWNKQNGKCSTFRKVINDNKSVISISWYTTSL